MKRENIEVAIQRLYYVLWALWVAGWLAFCVGQFFRNYFSWEELAAGVACLIFPPPLLMLAVRWVYRGLYPVTNPSKAS